MTFRYFTYRRWVIGAVRPWRIDGVSQLENAVVTEDKLCDYLLNPSHPVGGPKAAWFASIGYTRENWTELRDDLPAIAVSCGNFIAKPSPFGVKYETVGDLGAECHRPGTVIAVWIVEENLPPRLVTAYPGNG